MRTERRFAGRYSPMTCGFEPWKACSAGVPTRAFAKGIGFQQRAGAGVPTRAFAKGIGFQQRAGAGVTTRAFAKGIGFQQRAGAGGDTRATSLPCRQQVQINNGKAHPVCAKRWQSQMR